VGPFDDAPCRGLPVDMGQRTAQEQRPDPFLPESVLPGARRERPADSVIQRGDRRSPDPRIRTPDPEDLSGRIEHAPPVHLRWENTSCECLDGRRRRGKDQGGRGSPVSRGDRFSALRHGTQPARVRVRSTFPLRLGRLRREPSSPAPPPAHCTRPPAAANCKLLRAPIPTVPASRLVPTDFRHAPALFSPCVSKPPRRLARPKPASYLRSDPRRGFEIPVHHSGLG
jgi:hypothetical protein